LAVGDAHVDSPATDFFAVEGLNGAGAFFLAAHHDKAESAGSARGAIQDYLGAQDGSVVLEQLPEAVVSLRPGDVAHKEFCCHLPPA